MTAQYVQLFDQIWNNPAQLEDVTEAVYEHIASVYAENSPARIYFLILYNLFSEFLDDISEDVLPNDRTGYQDTQVWRSLYNFQRDAATGIINKLETYNGCILADSVGLGKTFTALAVIKYYELRNKSVLVLAPKKLAENWTNYNANLTTNIFARDRFNYDVLAHTDLSRTKGESMGLRLDRVNWGNYDLVVIDESHNFRNADYAEERESRYQRLMRQVIREGVKTKVLMLSATPVNNRFNDLKNQLQLAYEGESENLAQHLNISTTVEKVFSDAQRVFNEWSKLPAEARTTDQILKMLDFDFFELLDSVTIARSRKHIQAFYDTTEIGAFPERLAPKSIREPLSDLPSVPTFNEIFEQLQVLTLAVYTPLAYVFPSRISKYEDLYNVQGGTARSNLGQRGREQGLKKLMTVNLLKRLESSVEAFRLTLAKIEGAVDKTLGRLESRTRLTDRPRRRLRRPRCGRRGRPQRRGPLVRGEDQDRPRRHRHRVLAARPVERPRDPARTVRRDAQGHPRPRPQAPGAEATHRGQGRQPHQPGKPEGADLLRVRRHRRVPLPRTGARAQRGRTGDRAHHRRRTRSEDDAGHRI